MTTARRCRAGAFGELALSVPSIWLTRGLWRDPERYIDSYRPRMPGLWVQGDFASVNADGDRFVHGRSDDTLRISGKRTGPAEIEGLLLATRHVAEAAVVGVPDPIEGSAVVCVCVPARRVVVTEGVADALRNAVVAGLGAGSGRSGRASARCGSGQLCGSMRRAPPESVPRLHLERYLQPTDRRLGAHRVPHDDGGSAGQSGAGTTHLDGLDST
jgi:acyl-CoA synthetase (AMP-forming)/AMP-acid ligase II